ncbi:conjugative transposon protein TraK [Tenacibaculum finnmarkense]|uniref:conjugative transposon protein TraK n=1 Tax=Tenacibaculum finnmarkense TaxID=2781243 RepID=UPI001EFC160A|nr:conjugative transposon protein TraK [Tenacibaculum finnmarkense]MCG8226379.1 conjugative transposon protein TraK [Tenacibaculum finnmarkense genomovar finnmarkense]
MIIKNIESRIRISLIVNALTVTFAFAVVVFSIIYSFNKIQEERKKIYVLDNGVPILVNRTNQDVNRNVEYKSHINMFHSLFFTLPPDDSFIKNNLKKSMYLIDESGIAQYNNLKEKNFYNQIISSSIVLSIKTDSLIFNIENKTFRYFGTQRIDRKTSVLKRSIVTSGVLKDTPRTINNPHGVIIQKWKTESNKDLKYETKKTF